MSSLTTVELFDESFVFSSSEDLSNTIGAVFCQKLNTSGPTMSLLTVFGNTAENEIGYITLNTISEWINRYTSTYQGICGSSPVRNPDPLETAGGCVSGGGPNCFNGATGTLASYWWAVHNFLQYGGRCIIAGDNGTFSTANNPLVDKGKFSDIDVVFALDSGLIQANIVTSIVNGRANDCFGVVGTSGVLSGGVGEPINGIGGQSAGSIQPRGLSLGQYGMCMFGEKEHFGLLDEDLSVITSPLIPDAAGCLIRTDRDFYPWYSPAGYARGRILNLIRLKDQPSDASQRNLSNRNINFAATVSGQGTFLLSDKTLFSNPDSPYRFINVSRLLIYLIKNVVPTAKRYLFDFNNETTRTLFVNSVTPLLEQIQNTGGIIDYSVVCDSSNNDDAIISTGQFVADITIRPARSINSITIRFTNLNV